MKSLIKRKMISIILAFSLATASIATLPMNVFATKTYVTIEAPAYLTGDGAADVWDLVAKKSKAFKSNIQIAANGMAINGKISQNIISLGIKEKTKVTISADGDDATEAVSALQKLISTFVNMPVSNNAIITKAKAKSIKKMASKFKNTTIKVIYYPLVYTQSFDVKSANAKDSKKLREMISAERCSYVNIEAEGKNASKAVNVLRKLIESF